MDRIIKAPVLLIAFNRPDTTEIVFQNIREAQPSKLYIALDGARSHKPGEAGLRDQVLEITKKVDWACEAKYLIRDNNLGCKLSVSGAISWVLDSEDRVIVIEDDIVLNSSFYRFADDLLYKYQFQEEVAMISASNFTPVKSESDYFFSMYGHIGGGWATWKRVWDKFDVSVPQLKEAILNDCSKMNFVNKGEQKYYKKYFNKLYSDIQSGKDNYWGPQFLFFRRNNNLLSIVPRVNMSTNIGLYSARAGDRSLKSKNNFWVPAFSLEILNNPDHIVWNTEYDRIHFKKYVNREASLLTRIFRKALRTIKAR